MGLPFGRQSFDSTFTAAKDYNEWSVTDADTVGIFVNTTGELLVARQVPLQDVPGYDPGMEMFGAGPIIGPARISVPEIVKTFPKLPVFAFEGKDVVQIGSDGRSMGIVAHPYAPR
jgi:hypothetical protein